MSKASNLERVLSLLPILHNYDDSQGIIEGVRRSLEALMDQFSFDGVASYERVNAGGVAAEWVIAEGADDRRVVLYLHGGAYFAGSVRTHRVLMAGFSQASDARVLGIEYRLAPEHPFPAPVYDAVSAYNWLLLEGYAAGNIAVAGESAGGGLAVAMAVQSRYIGLPTPGALVCISPWVDMEAIGDSMVSKAGEDPMIQKAGIEFSAETYLGGRDLKAPLAAPLYADLRGLPPTLIQVGGTETLLDDAIRLERNARNAGVEVRLDIWEDMIHSWHLFAPILWEGKEALRQAGEFISFHTGAE